MKCSNIKVSSIKNANNEDLKQSNPNNEDLKQINKW